MSLQLKEEEPPGVVYVGHIPHGFFEEQMRKYFSQFGTVTRLKLSRSKKVCFSMTLVIGYCMQCKSSYPIVEYLLVKVNKKLLTFIIS